MRNTFDIGVNIRRGVFATLALSLVGCQSLAPGWHDSVSASVDENLSQKTKAQAGKDIPPEVSSALLPPIEISLPQGETVPLEPRFDLAVNNAPARQVFMGLVEGTPYSMMLSPEVGGTISLNLKEVTVPEALNAIRQVYGYEYRREGNRFFILGNEMQTRLFPVNYLNLTRKGMSDTRVSASGLTAISGAPTAGAPTSTSGGATSGVQIQTETHTDFWKSLATALTTIVGSDGGRKVIVNAQAGLVLVRAMPDELRLVEEYLGVTQKNLNRQVILEAKIIEVQLNNRFQTGINWSKVHGDFTASQVGGGSANLATTGTTPFTSSGPLLPGSTGSLRSSATQTSAFGGVFTLTAIGNNFTALIELLKAQGDLNVLSSPRVSTVNNQKAVIKVGTDAYFVTKQDTTAATATTSQTISTELSPFFSGIALDVTPQIDEAGNINLHIHPSVSDVAEKKIDIGLGADRQLSTALSSVQESDNIVRATSGQIVVIGGLMKEASTDDNASIPVLGDIPLIGNLFKHKKLTRIKRELVILLKPTIVNGGQDWNDAVGESQERIRKIRIGS